MDEQQSQQRVQLQPQEAGAFPEDVKQALAQLPTGKLLALVELAARRDPLVRKLAIFAATNTNVAVMDGEPVAEDIQAAVRMLLSANDGGSQPTTSPLSSYAAADNEDSVELAAGAQDALQQLSRPLSASGPSTAVVSRGSSGSDLASSTGLQLTPAGGSVDDVQLLLQQQQELQLQVQAQQQQQQLPPSQQMLPPGASLAGPRGGQIQSSSSMPQPGQQPPPDFASDEFRMYCYKVVQCSNFYNHSWNACPYAHPSENARRRDPRRFQYVAVACPYHKAGACMLGENCPYAHGVFEVNLHPCKYRTEVCRDGNGCSRAVCFFAHSARELRQPSLECSPTPEEFAATEGVRAQQVKAALPANHVIQGMIDTALQDAIPQLRLQSGGSNGGSSGGTTPGGLEVLTAGQAMLLSATASSHYGGSGGGGGNGFGDGGGGGSMQRTGSTHSNALLSPGSAPPPLHGDAALRASAAAAAAAAACASSPLLSQRNGGMSFAPQQLSGGGGNFPRRMSSQFASPQGNAQVPPGGDQAGWPSSLGGWGTAPPPAGPNPFTGQSSLRFSSDGSQQQQQPPPPPPPHTSASSYTDALLSSVGGAELQQRPPPPPRTSVAEQQQQVAMMRHRQLFPEEALAHLSLASGNSGSVGNGGGAGNGSRTDLSAASGHHQQHHHLLQGGSSAPQTSSNGGLQRELPPNGLHHGGQQQQQEDAHHQQQQQAVSVCQSLQFGWTWNGA